MGGFRSAVGCRGSKSACVEQSGAEILADIKPTCKECLIRVIHLAVLLALMLLPCLVSAQSERAEEIKWMSDERLIASVKLPEKVMTLKELCESLSKQTGSEFYVDRRYSDKQIAMHVGEIQLETAMSVAEAVSGLQWRRVGDIFFLTQDARGLAVVKWNERYQQAQKAELAGNLESSVREWLSSVMPFPPKIDPVWFLTPLQREQMAYRQAILPTTLTPPQIDWLNNALYARGYKTGDIATPVAQLIAERQELPVKINVAMVLHSPSGDFLVEKSLAPAPKAPSTVDKKPKLTVAYQGSDEAERKTRVIEKLNGLWVMGDVTSLSNPFATAKQNGLDAVFLPVFQTGHAIYPSKKFPQDRKYTDTDPLKQAVEKAHELGLKLIAVINATHWGDAEHPAPQAIAAYPVIQDVNLLGRRYAEQEKWQTAQLMALGTRPPVPPLGSNSKDKDVYLCPASSQAARLLKAVLDDIAGYEVDGVCFDNIDYPRNTPFVIGGKDLSPPFGYTVEVRREMIRLHQVDPIDIDPTSVRTQADMEAAAAWDQFRRGKLTGLVTDLAKAWKDISPKSIFCVTLNLESDAQSPSHWARIRELQALIPQLELTRSDVTGAYDYSPDMAEALANLNRYVGNNALVVPVIGEVRQGDLADQLTALGRAIKLVKDESFGGYILKGDARSLSKALEALGESRK